MNVRETIVSQPMSRFQIGVLITCLLVCMIDGFEILVMGFVVPALGKAWHLSPVQVGYVLAAGIFGMAMGSTFLSPLADKFGRRKHVLLCMLLIVVGMVVSARRLTSPCSSSPGLSRVFSSAPSWPVST